MRPSLRFATCATILAALAVPVGAQGILGRITKKAADAVEKKAEDKVYAKLDQMAQKMVDNSFAAMFGDSANPAPGGTSAGADGAGARGGTMPFSIGSNAKTEANYTFDVVTTMETEGTKRGKSDGKAVLKFHFNSNAPYTGTSITSADGKASDGAAFVILDAKNQAMVMLMASDKSKFSIAYDWKEAQKYAEAAAPTEQVNWDTVKVWRDYKRIGTKTIAGYSADGYRTEGQDGTAEIWVSRDKRLAASRMFAANSGLKQMKGRLPADSPYGMLLEMTSVKAGSGDTFTMKVTNVETNARVTYAMSDYPRMEIGKK